MAAQDLLAAIPGVGPILAGLFGGLKEAGVIRTPEDELKVQLALEAAAVDWVKVTTPAAEQTPRWVNGLIASTRPLITWLVVGTIVTAFFVDGIAQRISDVFTAFAK